MSDRGGMYEHDGHMLYGDGREVEPTYLRPTAQEALDKLESNKKRAPNCTHERLNEDGICHRCGADRRGI